MQDAGFYPFLEGWDVEETDPAPLLQDMLEGGLHGAVSTTRLHSAGITMQAAEADRQGREPKPSLLPIVFPSAKSLASRYPYLRKAPVLLPLAWGRRILHYATEIRGRSDGEGTGESLLLGRKRVRLLELYGMIGRAKPKKKS